MERRLTNKVQSHIDIFKHDIIEWFKSNKYYIVTDGISGSAENDLIEDLKIYIGNYNDITFQKEDFLKRKRVKNMAPHCERCHAKRADGSQCTRRKKDDSKFCGTHSKGTPHGEVDIDSNDSVCSKKVEVKTKEFNGIVYYIDDSNNVYRAQDIVENKHNPPVFAKWEMVGGKYTIPSLNLTSSD